MLLEAKTTKKLPKHYVYSGIRVPREENKESGEGPNFEIPVGLFFGRCKKACNTKIEISTSHSVALAGTKNRVWPKVAPELRLSMFQRSIRRNGSRIRPPEKTIERASEGISSYIYEPTD